MSDAVPNDTTPDAATEVFTFVADAVAFRDEAATVIRVPSKARGKEKVLNILSQKLRFPRYFGHNWDALDECLGNLSWFGDVKQVTIVHEGLPFSPVGDQLAIYLAVLSHAVAVRRTAESGPKLTVVFPAKYQEDVMSVEGRSY